jgi:hypothetical protein
MVPAENGCVLASRPSCPGGSLALHPVPAPGRPWRRAGLVGLRVLVALSLVTGVLVGLAAAPSAAAPGSISGTVFRDWNQNGVQGAASGSQLAEPGVAGIQVQAFDAAGTATATATTDATGRYTLSLAPLSNAVSSTYRVQYTIPPALSYLRPGPVPAAATPGTIRNGTSVQFSAANTSTPGTAGVDFGVANPADYCQANPTTACPVFRGGAALGTQPTIESFPYDTSVQEASEALENQTGAVWGLAYDRSAGALYSSAFAKRHSPYSVDTAAGPDRIFVTTAGGATDAAVLLSIEAGNTLHDATIDNDATFTATAVGREGFGDIDVAEDDRTLWVVNLATNALVQVDPGATPGAGTGSVTRSIPMPNPGTGATGCPNSTAGTNAGNLRPGGLDVKDGLVYVTLTCTAENVAGFTNTNTVTPAGGVTPNPDAVSRRAFLRGFVYTFDPVTTTFTEVANFPLNYNRGCVSQDGDPCGDADDIPAEFNPWTPGLVHYGDTASQFGHVAYPQPWLSGVEVDDRGFLSVAVMDRFGHMAGNDNSGTGIQEGVAGGDLLRLARTGSTWTLEANAASGGDTGSGVGNNQGPGGGEFFAQENFGATHQETTVGGIANRPGGRNETVASVYDPESAFRAGGVRWYSNSTGAQTDSIELYGLDETQSFGKVNGIGDLEVLCDQAPVQIGNRVWLDEDGDGVQDPEERPIANLTVELRNAANTATVATTTTDANGQYLFSNVARDTAFTLRFDRDTTAPTLPAGFSAGSLLLTDTDVGADDAIDSDAVSTGDPTQYTIPVPPRAAGNNDHRFDLGLAPGQRIGNVVWLDADDDGVLDTGETPIAGVDLALYVDDGDGVFEPGSGDGLSATTTTDANGRYWFTRVADGSYFVAVPGGQPELAGRRSSLPTVASATSDNDDNGAPGGTFASVSFRDPDAALGHPTAERGHDRFGRRCRRDRGQHGHRRPPRRQLQPDRRLRVLRALRPRQRGLVRRRRRRDPGRRRVGGPRGDRAPPRCHGDHRPGHDDDRRLGPVRVRRPAGRDLRGRGGGVELRRRRPPARRPLLDRPGRRQPGGRERQRRPRRGRHHRRPQHADRALGQQRADRGEPDLDDQRGGRPRRPHRRLRLRPPGVARQLRLGGPGRRRRAGRRRAGDRGGDRPPARQRRLDGGHHDH